MGPGVSTVQFGHPLPAELKPVLLVPVRFGIVLFTSDRGIGPAAAAEAAEAAGFDTFYVPEHTHIPVRRTAAHPRTGDASLPDDRYLRTLDPWVSLGAAAARTDRIGLGTAVALPVEHDPISLAKTIATLDHMSGGRVRLGVGFGWNTDELADHGIPPNRRRTALREYLGGMRALWTEEEARYDGEFVRFESSWAWPKPTGTVPVLLGAAGTEKNLRWIVAHADGWINTPGEHDVDARVAMLQKLWIEAERPGTPLIVLLDGKPDLERLTRWRAAGVSEVVYGMPDGSIEEATGYLGRLAAKLTPLRNG
ncbi:LLM class F420-dependent oxidoreductase [Skermania piniformis]